MKKVLIVTLTLLSIVHTHTVYAKEYESYPECKQGGAGVLSMQFMVLDTRPFEDLVQKEPGLKEYAFDFNEKTTPLLGIFGYYDMGYGTRTGLGVWIGYKAFHGTRSGVMTNETDSISLMRTIPAHIGFNMEKAFNFNHVSLFAGGMIGGGSYFIHKSIYESNTSSVFIQSEDDFENDNTDLHWAFAPYITWDMHGGAAVKVTDHFHVGIDGVLLVNYAPDGFGIGSTDFVTLNPGLRIRFTFGNAN